MAVNARETVIQAVRAFIIHATGLASASVIIEGDDQPRPAMPYVSVRPLGPGYEVGMAELLRSTTIGGQLQEKARGHRRMTVQVSAWGTDAADYLDTIRLALGLPTARASWGTSGVAIIRALNPRNSMGARATGFEERAILDLEASYRIEEAPVDAEAADHFDWSVTLDRDNPPPDIEAGAVETL